MRDPRDFPTAAGRTWGLGGIMSAEFYIYFSNEDWSEDSISSVEAKIRSLTTFVSNNEDEFWLLGHEDRESIGRWKYDVRPFTRFTRSSSSIFVEISANPKSIENDLTTLLLWLRSQADNQIMDEDYELMPW